MQEKPDAAFIGVPPMYHGGIDDPKADIELQLARVIWLPQSLSTALSCLTPILVIPLTAIMAAQIFNASVLTGADEMILLA